MGENQDTIEAKCTLAGRPSAGTFAVVESARCVLETNFMHQTWLLYPEHLWVNIIDPVDYTLHLRTFAAILVISSVTWKVFFHEKWGYAVLPSINWAGGGISFGNGGRVLRPALGAVCAEGSIRMP